MKPIRKGKSAAEQGARLTPEDSRVWAAVARTVRPLRRARKTPPVAAPADQPRSLPPAPPQNLACLPIAAAARQTLPKEAAAQKQSGAEQRQTAALKLLDRAGSRNLAKGRQAVEAKLDLHDHTQEEAHSALLRFLRQAQRDGLRHVLIITGQGRSYRSEGVLRKAVPHWLATAPFRLYVAAVGQAVRAHGGQGAFYVRLHRQK